MSDEFPLGPLLSETELAAAHALPTKPAAVTLEGRHVRLAPLEPSRHAAALFALTNGAPAALGDRTIGAYDADALVWRYMNSGPFADAAALEASLAAWCAAPDVRCFCVYERESGAAVGSASYMSNQPAHLKIELGNIWYAPLVQRTPVNTEATYLLLCHAFELGYRRVEWKCNALNTRSRRAALRMGFRFEGIQDAHMVVKGRSRDTAWFRILAPEWPEVKIHLELLLYGRC